jgi:hypothetical protein
MPVRALPARVCQYCNYSFHDGWTALLEYDETYRSLLSGERESTYGFHESWDDLREELY